MGMTSDCIHDLNVVWDTPSLDSSGSMPIGNGDIGANIWFDNEGDLVFYISKTDSFSEVNRLLKIGRIRISARHKGKPTAQSIQKLILSDGIYTVETDFGIFSVFVDANHPVIRLHHKTKTNVTVTAKLEIWRDKPHKIEGNEAFSAYLMSDGPHPIVEQADKSSITAGGLCWHHRNETSVYELTMNHQGLSSLLDKYQDPLLNRTFGGLMTSDELIPVDDKTLECSESHRDFDINIVVLTKQTKTLDEWIKDITNLAENAKNIKFQFALTKHKQWWNDFWERSFIFINKAPNADAVNKAYNLQRYINACAGRGAFPIKFNGSIFTVDSKQPKFPYNADYRSWGAEYWFQNTRLIYWSMLYAGDYEMMLPFFKMYADLMPFFKERTTLYYNHNGAYFPETMSFFGAYANPNYGWDRANLDKSVIANAWIGKYFQNNLEFALLALCYYQHTQDETFLKTTAIPMADEFIRFYFEHFKLGDDGKLFIESQSLETWQKANDPSPDIAGLKILLAYLLELPSELTTDSQRNQWSAWLKQTPELPIAGEGDDKIILPALEILEDKKNVENPELYTVFPYRIYGVDKPDIHIGLNTFKNRKEKLNRGWCQDVIQSAFLGLSEPAYQMLCERALNKDVESRFPAFWGPNFDWIPDQDHGTGNMIALRNMLLQESGDKLLLFPAWNKEWDVAFKLPSNNNTVVAAELKDGKATYSVYPKERMKDVTIMLK